jgi:hypothetical protein
LSLGLLLLLLFTSVSRLHKRYEAESKLPFGS